MEKIVIVLFLILAVFSVAFSASWDVEDVNTVVKIWTKIQEYVDTQEFFYGKELNQRHTDYVVYEILANYGITDAEDYIVGVIGTLEYRPVTLLVAFELNGEQYRRTFKIKHVKEKEIKDGCDDTSRCA
jgi:hypothetical protein